MATLRDELGNVPLFEGLTDEQLEWVCSIAQKIWLNPGDVLLEEGQRCDSLYVLLEGKLQLTKGTGKHEIVLATCDMGDFVGEIALLADMPHIATVRAATECRVLQFTGQPLFQMLVTYPRMTSRLLRTMARRIQDTDAITHQRDKMASLGAMAAGLAHELNNPASASLRAAQQLRETFTTLLSLGIKFYEQRSLTPAQLRLVYEVQRELLTPDHRHPRLDTLTRSDLEDKINAWLEAHGVANGWKLAPTFVAVGLDVERLDQLASAIEGAPLGDALVWLEALFAFDELLDKMEESTRRIYEIVRMVKAYSYMDQSPHQEIDVHDGLENTLLILSFKLTDGVQVIREYDRSLPRINAYADELNQVWTNLIDNAIDAVNGRGRIWVRTSQEDRRVVVEIADDGPGIPPEVQQHLFEPFFTTKDVGKGTGLGLNIAHQIVTRRHQGEIRVLSEPGNTRFQVRLPVAAPEGSAGRGVT